MIKPGRRIARHPLSILDNPVLPVLVSRMKFDLVVNEKAQVWLLHDMPFTEIVKWAEYDDEIHKLYLIMASGRQQELGIVIPDDMQNYLRSGRHIYLVLMQDEAVADCGLVPLMGWGQKPTEEDYRL